MNKQSVKYLVSSLFFLSFLAFFTRCAGQNNNEDKGKIPDDIKKIIEDNLLPCSDELGKEYLGGQFSLIKNIRYSKSKNLVGNLYLPYGINNFPIAIHIHGGAWKSGNRGTPMGRWWGEVFACNGIALYDIEYTLFPKSKISEQAKEIKCAILWAKKEGKKYGIGDKVILLGGSAGGHLTALVSFTKEEFLPDSKDCEWVDENSKNYLKVNMAIPFYGVFDLSKFFIRYLDAIRAESENIEEAIRKLSPINYIDNVDFPVLIIHGDADSLVPLDQSIELYEALVKKGKTTELLVVENGVHGFDSFPETEYTKKAKDKILEFLGKHGFLNAKYTKTIPKYNHIEKARSFLKRGFFKHAYLEFSKQSEESKNCETEYGKIIAISFDMLSQFMSAVASGLLTLSQTNPTASLSPQIKSQLYLQLKNKSYSPNRNKTKSNGEYEWRPNLNFFYENEAKPLEWKLEELQKLTEYSYSNSCTFYEEDGIPIIIENPMSEIRIGKKFGKEVPLLILTATEFIKYAIDLVFSHDINIELFNEQSRKYFAPFFLITGENDFVGLLRLLGILYVENPNVLNFIRPEKFARSKEELIKFLELLSLTLDEIFLKPKNNDVWSVKDIDGSGTFSQGDKFSTGKLYTIPEGTQTTLSRTLDLLELIPTLIDEKYIKRVRDFTLALSSKIKNNEPVNLGEAKVLIPDFLKDLKDVFPDFISFNIGGFFDAKKPLREFLPEVVMTETIPDMKEIIPEIATNQKIILPSFLIEGELGRSASETDKIPQKGKCYVCLEGERFSEYDGQKTYDGRIIKKFENDCINTSGKFLFENVVQQKIPFLYIYFKDPTLANNLFIGKISQGCGLDNENFQPATNFSLNKSISYIMVKLDAIAKGLNIRF